MGRSVKVIVQHFDDVHTESGRVACQDLVPDDVVVSGVKKLVGIDHSHLGVLRRAVEQHQDALKLEAAFEFVHLSGPGMQPLPLLVGKEEINPAIVKAADNALKERCDLLFLSIRGNEHNVLGLVQHPRPFDFVLPTEPDISLDACSDLVPYEAVKATLARIKKPAVELITHLRGRVKCPVLVLETPPPNPSEEHISRYPGGFQEKMRSQGISPAALRYKLWRTHSAVLKEACDTIGATFIPVPSNTMNPEGFLVEKAWQREPTHGNIWYGVQVLTQLLVAAGIPFQPGDVRS
ncbi:hypothetical protein [Nitrosomonas sp. Nm33]|uniref:hypothetical protein n=1 Tax=Nitrosomonas sp. Nm33 TaxID=133724 RepID=UPI0008999348|nr:hypothetical protein [Nitrosomonas sp. Nm33]SDZ13421.1 hypothetical protein SAMN05421755_11273 [Nitrosomonas sp. Nm33]